MSNSFVGSGLLSPEVVISVADRAMAATSREIDGHDTISQDIYNLALRGQFPALYIPAVKTAIDITLDVLSEPEVESDLMEEIGLRSFVVRGVSELAMNVMVEKNYPEKHFRHNYLLGYIPLLTIDGEFFRYKQSLATLSGAPFTDVSKVCGGVVNLLEQEGYTDEPAIEVVKRSPKLQIVGRMDKRYAPGASSDLGYPYIDSDNLQIVEVEEGIQVAFTPEAERYINDRPSITGGCPAGAVHSEGADGPSLFETYWSKIAGLLLPPNATADFDREMLHDYLSFSQ